LCFLLVSQEYVTLGQFCDFLVEPTLKYEDCAEVKYLILLVIGCTQGIDPGTEGLDPLKICRRDQRMF